MENWEMPYMLMAASKATWTKGGAPPPPTPGGDHLSE